MGTPKINFALPNRSFFKSLTPVCDGPNDMSALTTGHFMIGTPLTVVQNENITLNDMKNDNITLNRWQLIQQMYQTFWKRWSTEY